MSEEAEIILADPAATEAFGAWLGRIAHPGDVITLSGPLGAGKTSIARGLLAALGLTGEAPSPTFAIVQPYAAPETVIPVLHVDLYRIDDPSEIEELGLDEARAESLLVIEWAERAGAGAWPDALALTLRTTPDGGRCLTARLPAPWRARWSTR